MVRSEQHKRNRVDSEESHGLEKVGEAGVGEEEGEKVSEAMGKVGEKVGKTPCGCGGVQRGGGR